MTSLVSDPRTTYELVQRVRSTGQGGASPPVLLERICRVLSEAFAFDCVTAVRYDAEASEVTEVAAVGVAARDPAERRRLADVPLLARARDDRNLVLAAAAGVEGVNAFAIPLLGGRGCMGFLFGNCAAGSPIRHADEEALATVGVVAAILLENAVIREEMDQRDASKSEFVGIAVHELRNPLAGIYGIAATLHEREDALSEPERLSLRSALRQQTTRMRNLVDQLLDLSRLDLAAIIVSPQPLRLRVRIEDLVSPLASGRSDVVRIAVPQELEAVVDPLALDHMVSNLIANGLRYGKPPITITANRHDRHLRIAVEDHGDGVPTEFVPDLFRRFTRAPESRGRADGSGLGLAIAQAYARAHGGDIFYERAVPRGARFEIVIPSTAP